MGGSERSFHCCQFAHGEGRVYLYGTALDCALVLQALGPESASMAGDCPTLLDAWARSWLAMEEFLAKGRGRKAVLVFAPDWWSMRSAPCWQTGSLADPPPREEGP